MWTVSRRLRSRLKQALSLDFVEHEGLRLPPPELRFCGGKFKDDSAFLGSGREEAKRLVRDFGLDATKRLLEIGCGPARLPLGLLAEGVAIRRYEGVDIDRASIRWATKHVTATHPEFRFHHVEAQHDRYNPQGKPMSDGFRLRFEDAQFDIIYSHSVFANLKPDDVYVYFSEFARLLNPAGSVFLTAFVEEDVPDVTINPDDYIIQSSGALNVARYEKGFFFGICRTSRPESRSVRSWSRPGRAERAPPQSRNFALSRGQAPPPKPQPFQAPKRQTARIAGCALLRPGDPAAHDKLPTGDPLPILSRPVDDGVSTFVGRSATSERRVGDKLSTIPAPRRVAGPFSESLQGERAPIRD